MQCSDSKVLSLYPLAPAINPLISVTLSDQMKAVGREGTSAFNDRYEGVQGFCLSVCVSLVQNHTEQSNSGPQLGQPAAAHLPMNHMWCVYASAGSSDTQADEPPPFPPPGRYVPSPALSAAGVAATASCWVPILSLLLLLLLAAAGP